MTDWKQKFSTLSKLQKIWDELTPELRRKLFVGNSYESFRKWKQLKPKSIEAIREQVKHAGDAKRILKVLKKRGYMSGLKKMDVDFHLTFCLDTTRRTDPKKLKRSIRILRDEIALKMCEMLFDETSDFTSYGAKSEVKISRR